MTTTSISVMNWPLARAPQLRAGESMPMKKEERAQMDLQTHVDGGQQQPRRPARMLAKEEKSASVERRQRLRERRECCCGRRRAQSSRRENTRCASPAAAAGGRDRRPPNRGRSARPCRQSARTPLAAPACTPRTPSRRRAAPNDGRAPAGCDATADCWETAWSTTSFVRRSRLSVRESAGPIPGPCRQS